MEETLSIGYWIKRRRKSLDLTQKDLANLVGCALITITKIEADQRRPSREIAQLLAQHLQIPQEHWGLFADVMRGQKSLDQLGRISNQQFYSNGTQPAANSVLTAELPDSEELRGAVLLDRISRGRLVGRRAELATATHLWDAVKAGETRVLVIHGEPGIGKSRLALEVIDEAKAKDELVLVGGCFSAGERSYAPFGRIVQNITEFPQPLPEVVITDLKMIAPQLETRLPQVTFKPATDLLAEQLRLFESIFLLFSQLAGSRPIKLLIEDIHWADQGTVELIKSLGRRFRQAGIRALMILTTREELPAGSSYLPVLFDDFLREHLSTSVHINRFSQEETRALLTSIFDQEITDEFAALIHEKTQGNPFFIEEVCKELIEGGDIYWTKGRWERKELEEIQVPRSVQIAIQTRLNKLPERTQEILLMAAALGKRFEFDILQAAVSSNEDELIEAMETARRAQIIMDVDRADGYVFEFSHNLISSVLIDGVSAPRRRKLHKQVVEALEKIRPDEYTRLAYHCREATDSSRAVTYYRMAAERAMQTYAHEDAVRFYSEALVFAQPNSAEACRLLMGRAKVYDLRGERNLQFEDLQQARAQAASIQDIGLQAEIELAHSEYAIQVSEPAEVIRHARSAIELAQQVGLLSIQAQAYMLWGRALMETGDLMEARDRLERAGALGREAGLGLIEARSMINAGNVDYLLGNFDTAKEKYISALVPVRALGERRIECMALNNLGNTAWAKGNLEEAIGLYKQSLTIARDIGDRLNEARGLSNIGSILTEQYRYSEALENLQEAFALIKDLNQRMDEVVVLGHLADVMESLGRYQESLDYREKAVEVAREIEDAQGEADMLTGLGRTHIYLHRPEQAENIVRRALELTKEPGFRAEEAMAWQVLGAINAIHEKYDAAKEAYSNALALHNEMKQEQKSMEMHAELARLAELSGDHALALEHLQDMIPNRASQALKEIVSPSICLSCYLVLEKEDPATADLLLANGYTTIQETLAKISNAGAREHYLKNIPNHQALAMLWRDRNR